MLYVYSDDKAELEPVHATLKLYLWFHSFKLKELLFLNVSISIYKRVQNFKLSSNSYVA